MNIAFFSSTCDETVGWGNLTIELANFFFLKGIKFTLYIPVNSRTPSHIPWSSSVQNILPANCIDYSFKTTTLTQLFPLNRLLNDYTHVYSLDSMAISHIALRLSRKLKIPFIQGVQGTYGILGFLNPFKKCFHSLLFKYCHGAIGPSHFSLSLIQNFMDNYPILNKSIVIHNGVNFSRFFNKIDNDLLIEKHLNKSKTFIAVGALKIRKGLDTTLLAFSHVIKKYPNTNLKIIGPGSPKELIKICEDYGIAHSVTFSGPLKGEALVDEFRNAFAYIHSPRMFQFNFEGFGIVYLEANASGLPSIGTYSGGVTDAIKPYKTGLLAQEDNDLDLAEKIIELLECKDLYLKLCHEGQLWAKQHDWSIIGEHYLNFFNTVSLNFKHDNKNIFNKLNFLKQEQV